MRSRPLAFIAALCAWGCSEGPGQPARRVVPITLEQMLKTYAENPARADSEYRGRVFEFSARVESAGTDAEGHSRLEFRSRVETGGAVCSGAKAEPAFLQVAPGSTVKVRGKVVGIKTGTSTVVLSDCAIVP